MSVPRPPNPLTGHCAAIDGDVLYAYGPDHFQSLPLKKNATWSKESQGQSVVNPTCVTAASTGDASNAALYVIGGESDDTEYLGLQRYFFNNQSWETLSPPVNVLQTRTNHSAVYLNDSQNILVYGGSPSDAPSFLSSQTFLISTVPPYTVDSFTSDAPPVNNAILQPWNSSHAVMVGGDTTNTAVWLFGPDQGWQRLATNLSDPLVPATRAVIVDGADGSKVLQVYDLSVSPNTAQSIVLLGAGSETAPTGLTVGGGSSSRKRKRDLTIDDWPSYNSTNAPTSIRTDCSLSQNGAGLVVMAGGNEDHPVVIYNQNENSWVNADRFFDSKQVQQPLQPTSSAPSGSSTPTETSPAASPTTSDTALDGGASHEKMMRTLGITLGVLCGIAALFILVLLILRYRKMKAKKQNGGFIEEKEGPGDNNRLSFADRGASFMKEAGVSASDLLAPGRDRYNGPHNSHTSLAIMAGKIGNKRTTGNYQTRGSFESTTQLVKDRDGNIVHGEQHEMMDITEKAPKFNHSSLAVPGTVAQETSLDKETRIERKRSSGWSKYFATSQPTGPNGTSHIPSVYVKPNTKTLSVADSVYSTDLQGRRIPSSSLVPPLDIDFSKTLDGQRLSHVVHGSPAISDSREEFERRGGSLDIRDGQKGVIVDPADPRKSQATSISSYGNRSTVSSSITSDIYNESGATPWTPMSGQGHHHAERSASSIYSASVYNPEDRRPSRGKGAGFFPGAGTNYRMPKAKMSHTAGPSSEWASPRLPFAKPEVRDSTSSNMTVFPGASDFNDDRKDNAAAKTQHAPAEQKAPGTDKQFQWLNLGLNRTQS